MKKDIVFFAMASQRKKIPENNFRMRVVLVLIKDCDGPAISHHTGCLGHPTNNGQVNTPQRKG